MMSSKYKALSGWGQKSLPFFNARRLQQKVWLEARFYPFGLVYVHGHILYTLIRRLKDDVRRTGFQKLALKTLTTVHIIFSLSGRVMSFSS